MKSVEALTLKYFDHQRPAGFQDLGNKVEGKLAQVHDSRLIYRRISAQARSHVGQDHVHPLLTDRFPELNQRRFLAKVTLDEAHVCEGLHGQNVEGKNTARGADDT